MTKNQADDVFNNEKELILKLFHELNGKSFTDAKNILDATSFLLKENSFVNAVFVNSKGDCDE